LAVFSVVFCGSQNEGRLTPVSDTININIADALNIVDQVNNLATGLRNMNKATDGQYAMVAAAILDLELEQALLTKMRPLGSKAREQLFDRTLRLAGKIDLAYALRVVDREFYNALKIMNKIRVEFAHTTEVRSFEDPNIAKLIASIPGLNPGITNIKLRYLEALKEIENHLKSVVAASSAAAARE
jgi:hypothetical protein